MKASLVKVRSRPAPMLSSVPEEAAVTQVLNVYICGDDIEKLVDKVCLNVERDEDLPWSSPSLRAHISTNSPNSCYIPLPRDDARDISWITSQLDGRNSDISDEYDKDSSGTLASEEERLPDTSVHRTPERVCEVRFLCLDEGHSLSPLLLLAPREQSVFLLVVQAGKCPNSCTKIRTRLTEWYDLDKDSRPSLKVVYVQNDSPPDCSVDPKEEAFKERLQKKRLPFWVSLPDGNLLMSHLVGFAMRRASQRALPPTEAPLPVLVESQATETRKCPSLSCASSLLRATVKRVVHIASQLLHLHSRRQTQDFSRVVPV